VSNIQVKGRLVEKLLSGQTAAQTHPSHCSTCTTKVVGIANQTSETWRRGHTFYNDVARRQASWRHAAGCH